MAALTLDQKTTIGGNGTFQARIAQVLREKAQYWTNSGTPTRADVNQRIQKRKKLAKQILNTLYADDRKLIIGEYWLTTYTADPAVIDGNGIPTAQAINDAFDPTYDYFAGVVSGDENETEIEW